MPENDGPSEFGHELLARASQFSAPVLPLVSTTSLMELDPVDDHSTSGGGGGNAPSHLPSTMPLIDTPSSSSSSSSSPKETKDLNPDAPPYEVRCSATSSAGPFFLLLGGNLPHPNDPSGTRLPLVASDQFHLLNCAANTWTRFNARMPPPAGLSLASPSSSSSSQGGTAANGGGAHDDDGAASTSSSLPSLEESWKTDYGNSIPFCRAGHAMCFLDGRLWVSDLLACLCAIFFLF